MPSHQEQRCQTTALRSTFRTVSGFHHDYCPSPRGRLTGFSWGWLSRWRCRGRVKLSPAGSQNSPWKSRTSPKGFSNGWTEVPRCLKMSFARCISQFWPITIKKYKKTIIKGLNRNSNWIPSLDPLDSFVEAMNGGLFIFHYCFFPPWTVSSTEKIKINKK